MCISQKLQGFAPAGVAAETAMQALFSFSQWSSYRIHLSGKWRAATAADLDLVHTKPSSRFSECRDFASWAHVQRQ